MPRQLNTTSRVWAFTIQVTAEDVASCKPRWCERSMVYMCYQLERAPTTGRLHFQGCVKLRQPTRLPGVQKLLGSGRPHVERAVEWEKLKEYCKKDETRVEGPFEFGEDKSQGKRSDLKEATDMILAQMPMDEVAMEHPTTFVKYHAGLLKLKQMVQKPPAIDRKAILIVGNTGVGKTRFVMDRFPEAYNVFDMRSPWFDGYDGQKVVLMDECGPGMMHFNILKQLTDRYPYRVPVKGGSAPWMAKMIFLTSNDHLFENWYPGITRVHLEALERRIKKFVLPHERKELEDYVNGILLSEPDNGAEEVVQVDDEVIVAATEPMAAAAAPRHIGEEEDIILPDTDYDTVWDTL